MEGLSHITNASPVENFLPLAPPQKRKAGFTKAAIASAASMAALAMFAPKVADANQITVTVKGTVTTGSDMSQPGQYVFGIGGSLIGQAYTLVYTYDDTKGTSSTTGTPPYSSQITGSNAASPATATVTINGITVSVGNNYPADRESNAERTVASSSSTQFFIEEFGSGSTGRGILSEEFETQISKPLLSKNYDWRSSFTYAPITGDANSGYLTYLRGSTQWVEVTFTATSVTVSGPSLLGTEPGKDQGTQQALCGCDGKSVNPSAGDPITISNGNMVLPVTDYQSGGTNQLTFTRTYNSMGSGFATFATSLGTGWRTNYDRYLNTSAVGNTPGVVTAERADGQFLTFTNSGSGWVSDADTDVTLSLSGSTWTLKDHNDVTETYNDLGTGEAQLSTITQRNGYTQTLSYTSGQLTSVTDSYSRSLSFTYSSGLLSTVTTPGGLTMTYGYGASGLKGATDDLLTSVSYNTSPSTSQTYKYELTTTQPLLLTGIVDENGNRAATWAYDSLGRATSSERFKDTAATMPVDVMSVSYNDATGARTVTNPLGLQDTYTFVVDHGLPKVSEIDRALDGTVAAASRTFGYDANGFQNCSTQWITTAATCSTVTTGDATQLINNQYGQPTSITEAYGNGVARTTTISYDPTFVHLPSTITEPTQASSTGRTTSNTYDGSGNLHTSTVTDNVTSASRTWTYTYNGTGEVLTAIGQTANGASAAQETALTYDGAGNLSTSTLTVNSAPANDIVTDFTSYDLDGRLKSWTDPNGLITAYTYDTRGHLLTQSVGTVGTSGGTQITTLLRDAAENITKVTKPDSSYLTYTLDAANRPTVVTDALGEHINYTLDAAGNATTVNVYDSTSALNRTHTYAFDALSRLKSDTDAYSNTTNYGYDNNSNRTSVTDPLSEMTSYAYDKLNRVSQVTDPSSNVTGITYSADTRNQVALVVDPRGFHTGYTYDGFGELTQLGSQDSGPTTYTYDNAGNVKTKQDANGNTTTNTFDSLNRIKTATYQDSTVSNYYYDTAANSIGRLKQISDPTPAGASTNTTYFGYDWYGNVNWKQNQMSGQNYYATYSANTNQLVNETYPSGMVVTYKYDAAGQMKETDVNGSWFIHDATHQPFGPVSGWTWGNGTAATTYSRSFDQDGRVTGYPLDGTNTRTVGYDGASRVDSIVDPSVTQSITYDANSRIKTYTGPFGNGSVSNIDYDANGNRTSITTAAGTETDTIDSLNNFLTQTQLGANPAVTYTPDAAGNTTAAGTSTYGYDVRNRQKTSEAIGASTSDWYYNGLSERIQRKTPNLWRTMIAPSTPDQMASGFAAAGSELTSTREMGTYYYNGSANVVYSEIIWLDHAGTAAQFGAIPIGANATGGSGAEPWNSVRAYTDQQNTIHRFTDQALNLYGQWDPDPFGNGTWNYDPAGRGNVFTDLRFAGQSVNDEIGGKTIFNTTRNYSPAVGRYLQSDPIGLAGAPVTSMNTYSYVGGNPANATDPRGTMLYTSPNCVGGPIVCQGSSVGGEGGAGGPDNTMPPTGNSGNSGNFNLPPLTNPPLTACIILSGIPCGFFLPEYPAYGACRVGTYVACGAFYKQETQTPQEEPKSCPIPPSPTIFYPQQSIPMSPNPN